VAGAWVDISTPLRAGMPVWPGDPPLRLERVAAIGSGDAYNLTAISGCLHTGTHVDAPLHYLDGGAGVERMPLDAATGAARVIGIRDATAIRLAELGPHRIRRGERVLFKTANSARAGRFAEFFEDYVYLARDAAEHLAARGVRAVGIDALSIGSPEEEGDDVHRILLAAGVWIIEGLELAHVHAGRYEMVCLPLHIPGADGAPARAMLRAR
jgi:arylformamidase